MKALLLFLLVNCSIVVFAQSDLPYKVGEYSEFTISFGPIEVGYADLEIVEMTQIGNKILSI